MLANHILEVEDRRIERLALEVEVPGVVILLGKPLIQFGELLLRAACVGRIRVAGEQGLIRSYG